jgi:hypothetical protein
MRWAFPLDVRPSADWRGEARQARVRTGAAVRGPVGTGVAPLRQQHGGLRLSLLFSIWEQMRQGQARMGLAGPVRDGLRAAVLGGAGTGKGCRRQHGGATLPAALTGADMASRGEVGKVGERRGAMRLGSARKGTSRRRRHGGASVLPCRPHTEGGHGQAAHG